MTPLAIIINIKAQNAAMVSSFLDAFKQNGIHYTLYKIEPKHLACTLQECLGKHEILLVGGGDGSIRMAAHYCKNTTKILGVLPLGTFNHFAKELALPFTPQEIITSLENTKTLTIDVAEVNGKTFINNSSLGFYPKFAKQRDFYSKKWSKWLSYLPSFINTLKKHDSYSMKITIENNSFSVKTSFLMISNNIYTYEFPTTIKRESLQNGILGLYFFKYGKIRLIKIIKMFLNRKNNFSIKNCKKPIKIHFNRAEKIAISLDGDTFSMDTPLYYKILPQTLRILVKNDTHSSHF